jgi:hypothetical protein
MPAGDLAARVRGRGPFGAMAARVLGRREDLVLLDLAEELLPQRPGQPVPGLVRALLTLPGDEAAAPSANDQAGPHIGSRLEIPGNPDGAEHDFCAPGLGMPSFQ